MNTCLAYVYFCFFFVFLLKLMSKRLQAHNSIFATAKDSQ